MDASSLWWMVHQRPLERASRDGACVRDQAHDDHVEVLFPERFGEQTIMFVHSTHENLCRMPIGRQDVQLIRYEILFGSLTNSGLSSTSVIQSPN